LQPQADDGYTPRQAVPASAGRINPNFTSSFWKPLPHTGCLPYNPWDTLSRSRYGHENNPGTMQETAKGRKRSRKEEVEVNEEDEIYML